MLRKLLSTTLLLATACTPVPTPPATVPSVPTATLPVTFTPVPPSATVVEPTYTARPTSTAYPEQATYTPRPTSTMYPSYTPYPTYTQPPTFTPTPTATMRSADGRQVRPRLIPHFSASYPEAVCWARWFYSVTEGRTVWLNDNPREYALCVATMGVAGVRYAARTLATP